MPEGMSPKIMKSTNPTMSTKETQYFTWIISEYHRKITTDHIMNKQDGLLFLQSANSPPPFSNLHWITPFIKPADLHALSRVYGHLSLFAPQL